ncbi:unnamed protein product [Symbiodinium natans]|uniref:Exostosin GT47 domain-containing protein n=1 Tax=Symbiodinium natans TaxID=878477 RepID=A0A812LX35_9DINO|nr:unnamed protein product [Symbiodinium natans]
MALPPPGASFETPGSILVLPELLSQKPFRFPPTRPVLYKMLSELIRSHPEWLPRVQNLSFHFQHEHAIALQTPYSSNHIFLGPNLTERSINGDAAFYRFRPSLCFEKEGYCKAATTGILVEYAMPNMVAIREARVLPPQVIDAILYVPPLIYDLFPKRSGRDPAMPITTWRPYTLTGRHGRNRRSKLLKRFKKHNISTQNLLGLEDGTLELQEVLRHTAIMLNVHQTEEFHTIEELRILPAILCGVVVISEVVPYMSDIPWRSFVVWTTMEKFPETVKEVQANFDAVWDSKFGTRSKLPAVLAAMWRKALGDLEKLLSRKLKGVLAS